MNETMLAKVALILGIVGGIFIWLPCLSLFGIPMVIGAFICAILAKMNDDTSSTATAAIWVSSISLFITVIWLFYVFVTAFKNAY